MRGRALLTLASIPWAITQEALDRIGDIAALALDPTAHERALQTFEALERERGSRHDDAPTVTTRDGVATLHIDGPIFYRADSFDRMSGAADLGTLARDFNTALADPEVHSIILGLDTPGGEAAGIHEFGTMIREARGRKPITASVGSLAASGGYWIASQADRIVANATSFVGSIGVVTTYRDNKRMLERLGIDQGEILSENAPKKRPDPTTEAGRREIQKRVNALEAVFLEEVARGRGVTREKVVADFGQGASLIAADALAAGMIDALGDYEHLHAQLVADERRRQERLVAERRKRGYFAMDPIKGNGGATDDVDALRQQIAEANRRAEAAEKANIESARRIEAAQRETYRAQAETYYMELARQGSDGLAALIPAQRDTFIALYTDLKMIDTNYSPKRGGQDVSLAEDFRRVIALGPKHALLAESAEGIPATAGDRPTTATVEEALQKRGLKLLGPTPAAGEPKDGLWEQDKKFQADQKRQREAARTA